VLSERQAACNLLATLTPNGFPLYDIAPSGSVLGFGRITVSTALPHTDLFIGGKQTHPTPAAFRDRLAWILTVNWSPPSSCPAQTGPLSPAASSAPKPYPLTYQVYAVDATTGTDAITFVAKRPGGCGGPPDPATSAVPYQEVSVPWRNVSAQPAGQVGSIEARYAACETVPFGGAWVERSRPEVQVSVMRRLGSPCGPSAWHRLTLHPATVGAAIPSRLGHAETGPVDRVTESS
jgi:hypothetical protein